MTILQEKGPISTTDQPPATATSPISASITDKLRSAILGGEFAPGERLYEVPLSERLGASRTPIRTALQALAADGLLDYAPRRGYSVRRINLDEVLQAYEIRAALEGLAARRAAQLGLSESERRTFEEALDEGDRLLSRGYLNADDRIPYGVINHKIHTTINAASQSRQLSDMLRLSQQVFPSHYQNVIPFEYRDVLRRHDDHHRIFEAILCCDPGRAEMLMREHVERVKVSLMRSMLAAETAQKK